MDAPQAEDCPGKKVANSKNHVALTAEIIAASPSMQALASLSPIRFPRSSTGPTPEKRPACARSGPSEEVSTPSREGVGNTLRCSEYCVPSSLRRSGPSRAPRRIGLRQVR